MYKGLLLLLVALQTGAALAQRDGAKSAGHVEILNADRWEFDKHVATGAQRLLGHVRFRQENATMACDSAYLYKNDRVKAFGHVELVQDDTLRITGDLLDYNGATRTARMTGQVRLTDPGTELSTDALDYSVKTNTAKYAAGARIESRRDGNILASRKGVYDAAKRIFTFSDSVSITGPNGLITGDSLRYATASGMAEFLGPPGSPKATRGCTASAAATIALPAKGGLPAQDGSKARANSSPAIACTTTAGPSRATDGGM